MSLELYSKLLGPEKGETLNAMTELAKSYQVAGRTGEAIALEENALKLKRQHLPERDPMTTESMENLVTCYDQANRREEAKSLRDDLARIKQSAAKPTPPAAH